MNITAEAFKYYKSREIKRITLESRKLMREKPISLADRYAHVMKMAALARRFMTVKMASKPEKSATILRVNVD